MSLIKQSFGGEVSQLTECYDSKEVSTANTGSIGSKSLSRGRLNQMVMIKASTELQHV